MEDGDGGEGKEARDAEHTPGATSALLSDPGTSEGVANMQGCECV